MKKLNKIEDAFENRVIKGFQSFENVVVVLVSVIIGLIVLVSAYRLILEFFNTFIADLFSIKSVTFKQYQVLFSRILTLLISLEFMNSILKVLKKHTILELVLDVALIAGLAILRKMIVMDYEKYDHVFVLSITAVLFTIGVFYFLIRIVWRGKDQE